jgi:hypothetical protein
LKNLSPSRVGGNPNEKGWLGAESPSLAVKGFDVGKKWLVVPQNKCRKKRDEMKRLALAVGCLAFWTMGSSAAFAQDNGPVGGPSVRFGVEGGIYLANLNGPNVNDEVGSRLGFVGGAFLGLPLAASLALQPEILYSQKGGKYNGNPYQLDYWEVPILLDVTLVGPLAILLGPSFALNAANSGVDNINDSDIGLVAGAQLNIDRFLVSGRYEIGLTNVTNNQSVQNGTFGFLVGFSFI